MKRSLPRTEQRNPRTRGLDLLPTMEMLRRLNREDAAVHAAVRRALPDIGRAVERCVKALRRGGRMIYAGAGTSGRLAVLDAAECPPTFGTPRGLVQAVIAGGTRALTQAVEGAEDSAAQGARDLAARRVSSSDVVIGLTASGSTRYVLGALLYASKRGATTVGVTCNRRTPVERVADVCIVVETGAEAIAGSTRLKAGTAQKMVLNLLSTATMVRLGHVYDNWMIDVALTNAKLRRRGARILAEAAGATPRQAEHALRLAGHNLRAALVMLKLGVDPAEARRRLRNAGGDLRKALGETLRRKRPR